MMFEARGYVASDTPALEPGYEKVALYVSKEGKVTHAARQLLDGQWTSKLGGQYDVSHTLDALEGPEYGSVAKILKRSINGPAPTVP